jgi:hypothetical protein
MDMIDNNSNSNSNSNDETNPKKISIIGTNNRYQMKKLTQNKAVHKRKTIQNTNINMLEYSHELQKKVLANLMIVRETSNKETLFLKEIRNKISSYKQQDIGKKILEESQFVTLEHVIDLLQTCQLVCCYCSEKMYILYENVRENNQWTLDRIDNDKGHNQGNVVIACLKCNLKRRKISKDAFMFTKNMKIIKQDNHYNNKQDNHYNNNNNKDSDVI